MPPPSTHGCAARSEVDFPDDAAAVAEYMQLESEVRISTATYADGQPATHVRIVRTGGDEYFAVAWQIITTWSRVLNRGECTACRRG